MMFRICEGDEQGFEFVCVRVWEREREKDNGMAETRFVANNSVSNFKVEKIWRQPSSPVYNGDKSDGYVVKSILLDV